MLNNKTICLVIPCFNEEDGLRCLLSKTPAFLEEVIVIDNNSTDKTADTARNYGATVIHEPTRGYGKAMLAGLAQAKSDIIVTIDGDDSYPVSQIEPLLSRMEHMKYDFIVGCRYPLTNNNAQPLLNLCSNYFVSALIRMLFKINLKDSQSGMMAFKRDILKRMSIHNTDMAFSEEIKIKAFSLKDTRCGEMHIPYITRVGKVKFRKIEGLKNLRAVFSLLKELKQKR